MVGNQACGVCRRTQQVAAPADAQQNGMRAQVVSESHITGLCVLADGPRVAALGGTGWGCRGSDQVQHLLTPVTMMYKHFLLSGSANRGANWKGASGM